MKLQFDKPDSFRRTCATSSNVGSMSIAATWRAILAICKVNQPSPEHRSITSMPGFRPTLESTPAGSGHNASHQPAVGISVPSKNPALSDMSLIYFILRPLSTSGHASFVVDGARDATQEGIAAASRQSQRAPGIREQPRLKRTRTVQDFCGAF